MKDITDWGDAVAERLRHAGWEPGRRVDISDWCDQLRASNFELHEAFCSFIAEFGGLSIPDGGPGVFSARESIDFDPTLAVGEDDRFEAWSEMVGRNIVPIGELDDGRFLLGIDEEGAIYLVGDWLAKFGTGEHGMDSLILGGMSEVLFES